MYRMVRLGSLALCLVAALVGCARSSTSAGTDAAAAGSPHAPAPAGSAPVVRADLDALRQGAGLSALKEPMKVVDFELESLAGRKVKLSSFEGKVVLLNFWATWCPPCRAEIPALQALYAKLAKQGFEIVAVDLQEDKAKVAAFAKENTMGFTILLDTSGGVGAGYGASAIPTTYVVDRKGYAVAGVQGSLEWGTPEMEKYLGALLAEKP